MSELFQIEGTDIHIEGEGPETVVMIHGWPDTYRVWDGQVAALRSTTRCVRFTLPGFDGKPAVRVYSLAEVVALIAKIVTTVSPAAPVTLLLHDWGCLFGYQFYMQHQALVKRVAAVDIGDASSKRFLASLSTKAKLMIAGYQLWLAAAWKIGGALGQWMTTYMARALQAKSDARYINVSMNYPYYIRWTGAAGSYKGMVPFAPSCPLLFFYGTKKLFMFHSAQWAAEVAARPGCRVVPLDTGHWVMLGRADAFNAALLQWLGETTPAA